MIYFVALWLIGQGISVVLIWHFVWRLGRPPGEHACPPVAIVVAVKGHDIEFDGFLASIFDQDYPSFRLIFGVETADDAAVPAIEAYRAVHPGRVELIIASKAHNESQKITNLRAALSGLTAQDEVLVFLDADIWAERDFLRRLVAPLVRREADAVTAYPWVVPHDRRFSTFLLATISAGIATVPRARMWDAAWGGVMAITRVKFDALRIADAWRGAISEDLQLTNAVQGAGGAVLAPPELLMRTPLVTNGLMHIADQARRWYMLVRIHVPAAYGIATAVTTFNAAGWLFVFYAALTGRAGGWFPLLFAMVLSMLRTAARAVLVRRLWGKAGFAENRVFLLIDWLMSPLAAVASAILAWSSLAMRRTTWAGTTYEIRGPQDVHIVSRTAESP
jgi:Glycosyl transferase family 21